MKIGVVLNTADPETAWNALRFGSTAIAGGNEVSFFLLGVGVEAPNIVDETFDVKGQLKTFTENGGLLLACGTCLKSRDNNDFSACPVGTMQDLLSLVEESDRVVTFG